MAQSSQHHPPQAEIHPQNGQHRRPGRQDLLYPIRWSAAAIDPKVRDSDQRIIDAGTPGGAFQMNWMNAKNQGAKSCWVERQADLAADPKRQHACCDVHKKGREMPPSCSIMECPSVYEEPKNE